MNRTHGMMTRIIWDIVIVGRHHMALFEDRVTQNPLVAIIVFKSEKNMGVIDEWSRFLAPSLALRYDPTVGSSANTDSTADDLVEQVWRSEFDRNLVDG